MCGVTGAYAYGSAEPGLVTRDRMQTMADAIRHRGPDDGGTFVSDDHRVGFGFRRLSIVDLSAAGHQPMSNEDGTVWIVFNGEIYNHAAHRLNLERKGHVYRGRSDTETIIHLYEEYGERCVDYLRGMFAFAIWDTSRQVLMLARDRVGVKPLYYVQRGGVFLFASEIKALVAYPGVVRDVEPEALCHYLTFMVPPAPLTMFRDIHKLPAGCLMTINRTGTVRQRAYWDAIVPARVDRQPEEFYVERALELVRESVRLRMMSDVPVGAFLSGGVDSSTNVALMAEYSSQPINTFSVGFKDHPAYNELEHARRIAERFDTNHREIVIDHRDLLSYVPEMVRSQDEPIADWVCVPLHFVSKLARDSGVVVVQTGEGADELFCGYPGYLRSLRWQQRLWPLLRRLPSSTWLAGSQVAEALERAQVLRSPTVARLLRRLATEDGRFWGGAIVLRGVEKAELLSTPYWRAGIVCDSAQVPRRFYEQLHDKKPEADLLERMIYLELKQRLPELLLMRVDKITMATSIEAREPFLDHRLVEFAMSIPMDVKIGDWQTKALLKKCAEQLLPSAVVHRPKQGFGAPVAEWFRGELAAESRAVLTEGRIHERGYFNRRFIDRMLNEHQAGRRDWAVPLWSLFNLSIWYETWLN